MANKSGSHSNRSRKGTITENPSRAEPDADYILTEAIEGSSGEDVVEDIGYNRFETSAVWFETMEKQLLLNSVEVVERKTNCVFLLSLCGSFECTLATPVLIFERGAKKIFRCISAKHHTSHNVWRSGYSVLFWCSTSGVRPPATPIQKIPLLYPEA